MFCLFTDFSPWSSDKSTYWHAVTNTYSRGQVWHIYTARSETRMCNIYIYTCASGLIAYMRGSIFTKISTANFQVCACVCRMNVSIITEAGEAMSYGYRCRRKRARMIESFKSVSLHASETTLPRWYSYYYLKKKWVGRESTLAGAFNENQTKWDKRSHSRTFIWNGTTLNSL